jgi:uncharacterized protein YgiM (DUF1202 family)
LQLTLLGAVFQPDCDCPEYTASALSATASLPSSLRYITTGMANLREGPGEAFDITARYTRGTQVELLWVEGNWASVRVDGMTGYIYLGFLNPTQTTP